MYSYGPSGLATYIIIMRAYNNIYNYNSSRVKRMYVQLACGPATTLPILYDIHYFIL